MKGFMILIAAWALLMFNSAFSAQAQERSEPTQGQKDYIEGKHQKQTKRIVITTDKGERTVIIETEDDGRSKWLRDW